MLAKLMEVMQGLETISTEINDGYTNGVVEGFSQPSGPNILPDFKANTSKQKTPSTGPPRLETKFKEQFDVARRRRVLR